VSTPPVRAALEADLMATRTQFETALATMAPCAAQQVTTVLAAVVAAVESAVSLAGGATLEHLRAAAAAAPRPSSQPLL
jgi:hypothetical protein